MNLINSFSNFARNNNFLRSLIWYADSSNASRTITLNGTPTQSNEGSGVIGVEFDNPSDALVITDTSVVNFGTQDFTVEFFIKPANNNYGTVFDSRRTVSINNNFHIAWNNGTISYITNNNSGNVGINGSITVGMWSHVAVVRSSGSSILYINGIATQAAIADNRNLTDVGSLYIGKTYDNDNYSFNGKLAGIRVVKGVAIYSGSNITVPTSALTAVSGTQLLLNFRATAVPTVV